MYCVQVIEIWQPLVELVHPRTDWQAVRDNDLIPVAVGFTTWEMIYPELNKILPSFLNNGQKPLQHDKVRALVLGEGSAMVVQISPTIPQGVRLH